MDELTRLYSRRFGDRSLNWHFDLFNEKDITAAIMMLDIDDFKNINYQYGHDIGDQVLIQLAQILNGMVRSSDIIIRWGGDELIAIFPGLKTDQVLNFGSKLPERIKEIKIINEERSLIIT